MTTTTMHTLSSLGTTLGQATMEELLAQVKGRSKASLVAEGARMATPRISTDAARIYGEAYDFLSRATDDQLDHLPALGLEWLRVAVWGASEGDRRYLAFLGQDAAEATRQATSAAGAGESQAQLEAKRGQLHAGLGAVAVGDAALLAEVDAAHGSASDLPKAVKAQTALARKWRASGAADVKDRLGKTRLSDAWLDKADALADQHAASTTSAAATRSKSTWTQADVDHLDGINYLLLKSAVAQFEAGHAADPSIPRLTFNSLLSHASRSHHGG